MTEKQDKLYSFAKRVETLLKAGGAIDSMDLEWCRLYKGASDEGKRVMLKDWVSYRYGKPKEAPDEDGRSPLGLGFDEPASTDPARIC